jgi:hypothetical protein
MPPADSGLLHVHFLAKKACDSDFSLSPELASDEKGAGYVWSQQDPEERAEGVSMQPGNTHLPIFPAHSRDVGTVCVHCVHWPLQKQSWTQPSCTDTSYSWGSSIQAGAGLGCLLHDTRLLQVTCEEDKSLAEKSLLSSGWWQSGPFCFF